MNISPMQARCLLAAALLPFLVLAGRDQWLHLTIRRVTIRENLVHAALGVILFFAIGRAFLFDWQRVVAAAFLFAVFGVIDEFVFHRELPAVESDVHAKEHFALFAFFAVFALVTLAMNGALPGWPE